MLTVTILCFVWRSYPGWSEELLNEPMLCTVRDMEWVACLHDECKVVTYVEGPQLNFHYFLLREKQAKIFCSKQGHQSSTNTAGVLCLGLPTAFNVCC